MNTAINEQSQNEVKELLNEYVVSPLYADISESISKMGKDIETLDKTVKDEIGRSSSSVNGNISRLFNSLESHINDDKEEFETVSNIIEDNHLQIIESLGANYKTQSDNFSKINDAFDQLKEKLKESREETGNSIKRSKEELLSGVSEITCRIQDLLLDMDMDSKDRADEIRAELDEQRSFIEEKLQDLSALLTDAFERSEKTTVTVHNEFSETIAGVRIDVERKLKAIFIMVLSFGIVSTIGIIVLILIIILK